MVVCCSLLCGLFIVLVVCYVSFLTMGVACGSGGGLWCALFVMLVLC